MDVRSNFVCIWNCLPISMSGATLNGGKLDEIRPTYYIHTYFEVGQLLSAFLPPDAATIIFPRSPLVMLENLSFYQI